MNNKLKTLTLITTGFVVGVVIGRVGKRELRDESGFLVIDIDNTSILDVINEYSRIKNKRMDKKDKFKNKLNTKDFSPINLDVSQLKVGLLDVSQLKVG